MDKFLTPREIFAKYQLEAEDLLRDIYMLQSFSGDDDPRLIQMNDKADRLLTLLEFYEDLLEGNSNV